MGRSDDYDKDDNLETLGMYGIGMKRAIFKMGVQADVISWNSNDRFKVNIPQNWATTPGDWTFDIERLAKNEIAKLLKQTGTVVKINHLHKNISEQFGDKDGFVKDLAIALKSHYGYIISQGFTIKLNGVKIESLTIDIITSENLKNQIKRSIKPYVFTDVIDGVDVDIMIGFYRPFPTQQELDINIEGEYAPSSSNNAGITIICNDRVVLLYDKTFLTGWGEPPVPLYHTQFISITGVVHFRSNEPIKLPVTTTKRGLDTSSKIYAAAKNRIKDGLRFFTQFTNNWKSSSEERTELFKDVKKINALKPQPSKSKFVTLVTKKNAAGKYQIPDLPIPESKNRDHMVTISFAKDKEKVDAIRNHYHKNKTKSASEIGAWCFDKIYSQID